jgi:ubiquinone/menaquinone biosynthesis C-methylase UbiE
MAAFNGYLYAGTLNINEGFQVWKTDADGEPPFKWKKVLSHGAYRGKLNQIAMTLMPFKDYLYVGSGIQNGGFDFDHNLGPASPELIRINPDDSWNLIVGEPRTTPCGLKVPLSGLGAGFENPFAGYIWSMCVHEDWLYASTAVWAVFLRYGGKEDRWPKGIRGMFTHKNVEKMLQKFGGCDLWRTRDGFHWIPVTQNGFDNCFNIGFRTMVSSPYGLFVGAANPFAPEVAVRRVAGWNYEKNPRGGLEVWLGSQNYPGSSGHSGSLKEASVCLSESHPITSGTDESDGEVAENIIDQFYGGSDFRHFGFWRVGINDARTACENLMEEILAFIPVKKGTIVDIGCGLGATTEYLLKYFPSEAVLGITSDKKDLEACRKKAPHVKFLCRYLPKIKLPDESFDFVIWVRGLGYLCKREKLLRESVRILKAGGRLVCFDVLYSTTSNDSLWERMGMPQNSLKTLEEYRSLLLSEGFQEVRLVDVTEECLEGFKEHVAKYFGLKKPLGKVDSKTLEKVEEYLLMGEPSVHRCLLISGCKPETI